jgi:hypothetical protein
MKHKSTIISISAVAILIALALIFKPNTSTLKTDKIGLKSSDTQKTDRIEILHASGKVILVRDANQWTTSAGEKADQKKVAKLFKAMKAIQIKSPVAKATAAALAEDLTHNGTSVHFYYREKELYRLTFGSYNSNNYFKLKKDQFYFFSIKGMEQQLLDNYTSTDINLWLERLLINLKPDEIATIVMEYPQDPYSGFRIENDINDLKIVTIQNQQLNNIDPEITDDYLHFFSGIRYSQIDTIKTPVNKQHYLFRLVIKTSETKVIHLDTFELLNAETRQPDVSKFAAIVNGGFLVGLNYSDFDPIIVEKDYFLKK